MEDLDLAGMGAYPLGSAALARMDQLVYLDLSDTQVTGAGLKQLEADRPHQVVLMRLFKAGERFPASLSFRISSNCD